MTTKATIVQKPAVEPVPELELLEGETAAAAVAAPEPALSSQSKRRRQRLPLGTARLKLSLSPATKQYFKDRGEIPRWINNEPGRLETATEEDSYRFVLKTELASDPLPVGQGSQLSAREGLGSAVSRVVGIWPDGSPKVAYLMAKPVEDYEEDQQAKADAINRKEQAMRQGLTEPVERMYVPSTGIKIVSGAGQMKP